MVIYHNTDNDYLHIVYNRIDNDLKLISVNKGCTILITISQKDVDASVLLFDASVSISSVWVKSTYCHTMILILIIYFYVKI